MHSYYHSLSSAKRFGGKPDDYIELHSWLDESKAFLSDFRHRAARHHTEGIFICEKLFGVTLTNSDGKQIPVRLVAEQHVQEDLGWIPTLADWLRCIQPEPWMTKVAVHSKEVLDG